MKLIVGLGNPGDEYKKTRHNFGFLFLDYVQSKTNQVIWKKEFEALTADVILEGKKVKLIKPQTYMNLSGNAVNSIKNYYKVEDKDIIVIYDDVDLEFGSVRYRQNGSGGTHNGMKNVINMLSSESIPRIRLGIGKPKHENQDLADFVLSRFDKKEELKFNDIFGETYIKLKSFLDN